MDVNNNFNDVKEDFKSSLEVGIYSVWDMQLKQYDAPFSCVKSKLDDYMKIMVNDVASRFFGKEQYFLLVELGSFNHDSGFIECCQPVNVQNLDYYVSQHDRDLQNIIRTLNFLPQGYFKMPVEMKQDIQKSIDSSIKNYVENYVIPDMDVSKSKYELELSKSNKLANDCEFWKKEYDDLKKCVSYQYPDFDFESTDEYPFDD